MSYLRISSVTRIGFTLGLLGGMLAPRPWLYAIDNSQIPQPTNPVSDTLNEMGWSQKEAREATARKTAKQKNSVWVSCLTEEIGATLPCSNVTFVIKDSQQEEVNRVKTDSQGACTFSLPDDAIYSLVPLSKHYRFITAGALRFKRGEHVVVRLQAQ